MPQQHTRLTPSTILLLVIPPLLWAGNAVVGRMVHTLIPPFTFNFLRWVLALLILLPMAGWALRGNTGLWQHWRRYSLLGLLGVGLYNTLQYLALQTSSPINVTLVAASMPMWMLAIGALCFGARVSSRQIMGAMLSTTGVLVVLSRGQWAELMALRLVPGDLFMLLATVAWSFYSWMLTRTKEPAAIRQDWAAFLLAQVVFGLAWSSVMTAGEWAFTSPHMGWGWPLALALVFVAVGPAVLAYGCWGAGLQRVGPATAGFFSNLTPLFAALMSAAFLGDTPQLFHGVAFLLIVGGIVVSSRR